MSKHMFVHTCLYTRTPRQVGVPGNNTTGCVACVVRHAPYGHVAGTATFSCNGCNDTVLSTGIAMGSNCNLKKRGQCHNHCVSACASTWGRTCEQACARSPEWEIPHTWGNGEFPSSMHGLMNPTTTTTTTTTQQLPWYMSPQEQTQHNKIKNKDYLCRRQQFFLLLTFLVFSLLEYC